MSSRRCEHSAWIAQPTRSRYLYHCRECGVVISHDIKSNGWQVSEVPQDSQPVDDTARKRAFIALDAWMTEREQAYGHPIFTHPDKTRP